ncbi:hypothetical protein D039_3052B, partial [Vibrio parahaemolyticus EKP-028]
QTREPNR